MGNMKAFVALFALAAVASAESDPWYGYGYGYGLVHPYTAGYGCHNAYGAPVPCAGRKKREAAPVYFRNVKAEVTEHEGKHVVPQIGYAAGAWGLPVATYSTAEVPYKYSTVEYKNAPVEKPSDPTNPELVHTSQLGVCLNAYGFQVPC